MKIDELRLPKPMIDILKDEIKSLNEPQILALKSGLLEKRNLVVASPTASGKTIIAEMAFLKHFLEHGKTVYLVPLRALASEKYEDFRKKYSRLGMRVAVSTGDMDNGNEWLGNYDLIITSNEKMDSIIRHGAKWLDRVSLVICDEIHVLDDASRGPTLEIVIARLRKTTNAQILALSATIRNAEEIAGWLGAKTVRSDYRPVKLRKGVAYPDEQRLVIEYEEQRVHLPCPADADAALAEDTVKRGKQALFFVSTRKSSEAAAERLGINVSKHLSAKDKAELKVMSRGILSALSSPTKQCKRLAAAVENGAAFHHAGLVAKQRKIIEDSFRRGLLKILASTSTLAFGMNLPAWRVVIRDLKRYSGFGSDYIPVLEVHQMQGRAGRPRYDTEGEALILAKNQREKDDLKEMYIRGEPEPVYSKLSAEPALRAHVLALIASKAVASRSQMQDFFSGTFFAKQYGDIGQVMEKVEKINAQLHSYGFVEAEKESFILPDFVPAFSLVKDVDLKATPLGKRVSELYIDPMSAHVIVQSLRHMTDMEYILCLLRCAEMQPLMRAKKKECEHLESELEKLGIASPDVWETDYEDFLDSFKTALMFRDWMSEAGESRLMDIYGITPGELHTRVSGAEWIFYAARELALVLWKKDIANRMNKLMLRAKHGVKEELLRLVKIKGIGRVRARLLFRNGIKGAADIRKNPGKVEELLGMGTAKQILEQMKE